MVKHPFLKRVTIMSVNRKAAEAETLAIIEAIIPNTPNTKLYQDMFEKMNDEQFNRWIESIADGSVHLAIIVPEECDKPGLSVERNLDLAETWGYNFFEKVWLDPQNGAPAFLSNDKYLIIHLPLKRQSQFLQKKITIPEDNRSIDTFTGQPTGKSKGAKISWPELQILGSLGEFDNTIYEFFNLRGGDLQGFNAMNHMIAQTGGVSTTAISSLGTKVKAVETLSTLLTSMHLTTTLPA